MEKTETKKGKLPLEGFPREMAVKKIQLFPDKDGQISKMQKKEIDLMQRLSKLGKCHPNIVQILHSELQQGTLSIKESGLIPSNRS